MVVALCLGALLAGCPPDEGPPDDGPGPPETGCDVVFSVNACTDLCGDRQDDCFER